MALQVHGRQVRLGVARGDRRGGRRVPARAQGHRQGRHGEPPRLRLLPRLQAHDHRAPRRLRALGGGRPRARGRVPREDQGHRRRLPGRDPDDHQHAHLEPGTPQGGP
ncbi:expressed protein [Aureococcus anophagefferens]|uniref:Expressed protein n=1 Tax=Aureococcus anophagefferens TaxID=44056 RepID=F0XYH2_AURAN|nr:expressed protein [Aureococcus anophagefferens]EGB12175.1 expressed protein [Aureococcus anophagefferens]|eukprot:XP_009033253.1 expressed protein [Aureococcus anophagefferens]